jgi:DNA-directed RNA polymerase sigma subunit (sigma70/sigma32)
MIFDVNVSAAPVGTRRRRPMPTVAMADSSLSTVKRLAERERRVREQLVAAIRDAATTGHSLRAIAEAAGVGEEQVRRILKPPRA